MTLISRRQAIARTAAAAVGASLAWRSPFAHAAKVSWRERRDLYPQGVASGDPDSSSVLLWTRRPPHNESEAKALTVEVAADPEFRRVVANAETKISSDADWTCRVLAAGLEPAHVYWYRFTDEHGFGSRVGRTITAPSDRDRRPISFAFVSCQNVQQGACNAYRRMIWEDERRPAAEQLGFVLHLGDFVYELVWYPEDRPQGMYDRGLRDIVRYKSGEKIEDFHVPTTVEDYRAVYAAYLTDPDLQDARARWPFVCMGDNHEFSWKGWQSQQNFGQVRPAQTRRLAANQAWFEYQPARVVQPGNLKDDRFHPPVVADKPINKFDEDGIGQEPGNLAAISSLKTYRALRWGSTVELILTDNHSFRSEPVGDRPEAAQFELKGVPLFYPVDVLEILDAGRAYNGGKPPDTIKFQDKEIPNPRKTSPPQSVLGTTQKEWFFGKLRNSKAPWKLWGNSFATLEMRTDLQDLPAELGVKWPTAGYATMGGDWTAYCTARAEIFDFVKREKITGFATIVGDRHAFFAGLLSASLPPKPFEPVGAEFVTGSISAPGLVEALSHRLPKDHPLRPIFLYQASASEPAQPAINLSLMHGAQTSLTLKKTGDVSKALAARNPNVAPHLSFVDMGGHGYSVVRATAGEMSVEFVCIPRPLERSASADGGPLVYRVAHRVAMWKPGAAPRLEQTVLEGNVPLMAPKAAAKATT